MPEAPSITREELEKILSPNDKRFSDFWSWVDGKRPWPAYLDYADTVEAPLKDHNDHFFDTEWERIQIQTLEGKSKPGYFKIGTVALTIPPSQITISDVKNNFTYSTIRATGDITFQSGHTSKIIELDVVFHDLDSINNKLRPLLAQLRCTPFIPIENDYVRSVLSPQNIRLRGFAAEREDRGTEFIDAFKKLESETQIIQNKMKEEINKTTFYPIEDGYSEEEKADLSKKESETKRRLFLLVDNSLDPSDKGNLELNRSIPYNVQKELTDSGCSEATKTDEESLYSKIVSLDSDISSLKLKKIDSMLDLPSPGSVDGIIPAVLSQIAISTVPGLPEALACNISLFVFNCLPYSPDFAFRKTADENGEFVVPTKQIDECDAFVRWYSKRYLSDRDGSIKRITEKFSNNIYFETLRRSRRSVTGGKYQDFEAVISLDTSHFLNAECVSIAISFSNRIKFLPIIGYGVPTCQYLGSNSSTVALTFSSFPEKDDTHDVFLESMRYFFEQIDATSRETTKDGRRAWVTAKNDIVNMAAIENLIIQSFDVNTIPGSPGMSAITLRFIDISTTFEDREKIRLLKAASDARLGAFIENEIVQYSHGQGSVIDSCLSEMGEKGLENAFIPVTSWLWAGGGAYTGNRSDLVGKMDSSSQYVYKYYENAAEALGYSMKKAKYNDADIKKGLETGNAVTTTGRRWNMRINSSFFDAIWVKKPASFDWVPLDKSTRKDIASRVRETFLEKKRAPNHIVDKDIAMLLFRGTVAGQRKLDEWEQLLKNKEAGEGYFPPNVEKILERDNLSFQRDPAYKTYEDMDLPLYGDIGIGYAPSYADLGIPAPRLESSQIPARGANDIVEPDFYFDHHRLKDASRSSFNFDAGSWGKVDVTYNSLLDRGDQMHSSQGDIMKQQVSASIEERGDVAKQETDSLEEQKKGYGLVDKQDTKTTEKDLVERASIVNRINQKLLPIDEWYPNDKMTARVSKVIDGDTIMIDGYDEHIRVIGINTPEFKYKKDGTIDEEKSDPGAMEAKEFAERTLNGREIVLTVDALNLASKNRGAYGRPLMYVDIIDQEGTNKDFGEEILRAGLAAAKVDFPNSRIRRYVPLSNPKHDIKRKDPDDEIVLEDGNFVYDSIGSTDKVRPDIKQGKNEY